MPRRFAAVLALLAFIGANVAVALHYGHHHEHHAVVLREAAVPEAACACSHHGHSPANAEGGDSRHSHPPQRSPQPADDHCLICQSLANKPLLTAAVAIAGSPEWVEFRSPELPAVLYSADRGLPFSRGPPTA
jgi:hypothetical protein